MSELTFESAQKELEGIVEFGLAALETAEGRIEELAQRAADATPLPPGGESG